MAMKRKASSSLECSSSQRAWYWRSGIFRAITQSFYRGRTSTLPQAEPTSSAGQGDATIDAETHQQLKRQSTNGTTLEQSAQAVQASSATDLRRRSTSGESHEIETRLSNAQWCGRADECTSRISHPRPTDLSTPRCQSADAVGDAATPSHSQPTWNRTRLRIRSSRKLFDTHTEAVHGRFKEAYRCQYSLAHFVGLCAYLSALMRIGYRIRTGEIDGFIRMHAMFMLDLKNLEGQQSRQASTKLIAYHHWYSQQGKQACDGAGGLIVAEHDLRRIWLENPFVFLKVKRSLDRVVQSRT